MNMADAKTDNEGTLLDHAARALVMLLYGSVVVLFGYVYFG